MSLGNVKKLKIAQSEGFKLAENLFNKAKSMMDNFTGKNEHDKEDADVIKRAIEAAYTVATPEEKEELKQLEQQLNELK